ncbi:hypothetical protein ACLB1N_28210 [Escherichia coli]
MATSRYAPTINPIATERKKLHERLIKATLKKGTAAAYPQVNRTSHVSLMPGFNRG